MAIKSYGFIQSGLQHQHRNGNPNINWKFTRNCVKHKQKMITEQMDALKLFMATGS